MFSEILKIIPKLDDKDLDKMQKSLQGRFTKIAKGFGKGLVGILTGGGLGAIGLGLIDKLLNPLKEVQEAIDRTLKTSDDLATNANQFNTTTGKLAKLVGLAKGAGLDQENLFTLMNKFQGAVAQAKADPTDNSVNSVRNFVGREDTAEAFFSFINELKTLNRDQQVLVQQQVFGEKQILKMSDFLNSDFAKIAKISGIDKISSSDATRKINKTADLNDLQDSMDGGRFVRDLTTKSDIITKGMIMSRAKSQDLALERENKQLASYENLATISQTVEKMMIAVDAGVAMVGKLVTWVIPWGEKLVGMLQGLMGNSWVKKGIKLFGGKDGE